MDPSWVYPLSKMCLEKENLGSKSLKKIAPSRHYGEGILDTPSSIARSTMLPTAFKNRSASSCFSAMVFENKKLARRMEVATIAKNVVKKMTICDPLSDVQPGCRQLACEWQWLQLPLRMPHRRRKMRLDSRTRLPPTVEIA